MFALRSRLRAAPRLRAFLLYGLRRLNHRLDRRCRLGDLLRGDVEVGDDAYETLSHRTDAHAVIGEALGDLVGGEAGFPGTLKPHNSSFLGPARMGNLLKLRTYSM